MRMNEIKIVEQLDRGLAYAEACFETFSMVQGQVFERAKHQRRLQAALKTYGLICTDKEVKHWFCQAIAAAVAQGNHMMVRLTVSMGDAEWGLLPKIRRDLHVQVQIMPFMPPQTSHLQTVTWPFPLREKRVKYTSDYAESLRAIQQWQLPSGVQALICSSHGGVLSTLTANIALYRDGQWYTPQGLGVLHGVIRQFLLRQGILQEAICPIEWLGNCEAMVYMNSGVFVQPVVSINQRELSDRHPAIDELYNSFNGLPGVPWLGGRDE